MIPQLKTGIYFTLLLMAMLASIFGAGLLSIYASGVSSSISMTLLNKSTTLRDDKITLLQVRKRNFLEEFSSKNQRFHLVKQDYSGVSAFLYLLSDEKGKIIKTILIRKNGISAFSPYIGDAAMYSKENPSKRDQNPILNAIALRAKALQQQIESEAFSARSEK